MIHPPPSPAMVASALIVDDHEADVVWCRRMLERSGRYAQITVARSAREVLELFDDPSRQDPHQFPPDVVFLDINMPGMDGYELLTALEARRARLEQDGAMPGAVLMLSSSDDVRDVERSRANGLVDDYIVKPITPDLATAIADRYGRRAA